MKGSIRFVGALTVIAVFIIPAIVMVSAPPAEADGEFTSYYDQLNVNEKAVYDAVNTAGPDIRTITVNLPVSLSVRSDDPDAAQTYLKDAIKVISDDAFVALRLSSPLGYWGWDANSVRQPTFDLIRSGDQFTVTSLTWTAGIRPSPNGPDGASADVEAMIDELKKAADKFRTESTTVRDKIWDINNYLVNLITYDPFAGVNVPSEGGRTEGAFSHDAYGALVLKVAVCDGYSKAFQLLCQKENIDCVVVFGTSVPGYVNHAWNYVKLDDGKWYAIDVTWNDNGNDGNPYFLKGGDTFFATHSQGVFLGDGVNPYPFRSPAVSNTDYDEPLTEPNYDMFGWIAAAMIVLIIAVMLYRRSREDR